MWRPVDGVSSIILLYDFAIDPSLVKIMRSWLQLFVDWAKSPDTVTELLQVIKGVFASSLAWWLAVHWQNTSMPFLAPWTALLTVHATAFRSLTNGLQMAAASGLGVVLSFLIGQFLGVSVWTMALALFIGVSASYIAGLRQQGIAIATTALFLLASGWDSNEFVLLDRLEEVLLGVVLGIAINLLLIPPVRGWQAARYVDHSNRRMGSVMINMADELAHSWNTDRADVWLADTKAISTELETAWSSIRLARESARWNPRIMIFRLRQPASLREQSRHTGQEASYQDILQRVEEGVSHLRHLVRTLREATYAQSRWDNQFRRDWTAIVRDAGHTLSDPDADVEPIYDRLNQLAKTMSTSNELPHEYWPVYGSLIMSMRHIAIIVDDVASARQAREAGRENPRD